MTIEDRAEMFGQPSDSLVPEAVWMWHEDEGAWPTWDEAIAAVVQLAQVDEEEAESRLLGAIADEEVLTQPEEEGWLIRLDQATADKIARRYLDMHLKRPDEAELWRE